MAKKRPAARPVKRKSSRINIKSDKGLIHHLDVVEVEELADQILQKYSLDSRLQLANSVKFNHFIGGSSFDRNDLIQAVPIDTFRICFGGYDPLSVAGTLTAGGRFNIGGPQVHLSFPKYTAAAGLYAACSLDCAKAEVGPHKNAEIYAIKSSAPLNLWDLSAVISRMSNPQGTYDAVDATPANMQWILQKFPMPSQMLAATLRGIGGDGLFYPSSKHTGGRNYCFFAKDDRDIKSRLSAVRITEDQLSLPI